MITKTICIVVDKKGEDILAPQLVPNHAYALRQFQMLSERSEEVPVFCSYPEDYILVTGRLMYKDDGDQFAIDSVQVTPFESFITKCGSEVGVVVGK